jgi:hypothetical protein
MNFLCVIFPLSDPSDRAMFTPVITFRQKQIIKVKLDQIAKLKLCMKHRAVLLKIIHKYDHFVALFNQQLQLGQSLATFLIHTLNILAYQRLQPNCAIY